MLNRSFKAKQLVILSGKGGTGKTSLSAAFAFLTRKSQIPALVVDADVDAANLSLILTPEKTEGHEFWGGSIAQIDSQRCIACGDCERVCRYDAVVPGFEDGGVFSIDPIACDGCAACVFACSQDAIQMVQQQEGYWFHSQTQIGELFHAELFPGRENSGKLVTLIKQQARLRAEDTETPLLLVDGPPGIGCPVISACAGADASLVVTEPSQAGLHDLKRIMATLQHFRIPAVICINKADIYPEGAQQIRAYAEDQGVEVVGVIPFDESIPNAMVMGKPVNEAFPKSPAANAIKEIWNNTILRWG